MVMDQYLILYNLVTNSRLVGAIFQLLTYPLFQASRILYKLIEPITMQEVSTIASEVTSASDETSKSELSNPVPLVDYSSLFGEEFLIPDDQWDSSILNVLDIGAVEEGILHVLYACASQVDYSIRDITLIKHHSLMLISVLTIFIYQFTFFLSQFL